MTLHDTTIDPAFASAFFLSFRLFTSPMDLTEALIARFDLDPPAEVSQDSAGAFKLWQDKTLTPVRLRVFNMFKIWLESHWHPETDAIILASLQVFTQEKLSPIFKSAAARLHDLILKRSCRPQEIGRLRAISRAAGADRMRQGKPVIDGIPLHLSEGRAASPTLTDFNRVPAPPPAISKTLLNSLRTIPFSSIAITDFDPLELARQITIFESRIFCMIQPEELLSQDFSRKTTSVAVNIKAMTSLSTQLTGWIAEIILNEVDARRRTYLVKYFIKLAEVRVPRVGRYGTHCIAAEMSWLAELQHPHGRSGCAKLVHYFSLAENVGRATVQVPGVPRDAAENNGMLAQLRRVPRRHPPSDSTLPSFSRALPDRHYLLLRGQPSTAAITA
jgi:son of sevenless-like protein